MPGHASRAGGTNVGSDMMRPTPVAGMAGRVMPDSSSHGMSPGGDPDGGMDGGGRPTSGGEGSPVQHTCGTLEDHRRLLGLSPAYARTRERIEDEAHRFAARGGVTGRPGTTTIPVVAHVVWNTAAQNVSDARIASQIDVLNPDFRRTNPDVNNTPASFLPLAGDARIEFTLAGVTRTRTSTASSGSDDAIKSAASGGADPRPPDQYLDMWVGPLGGGLPGYARFPGGPAATDGVVIVHSAFGTTATAAPPFHRGRTATHEIGHWLNLNQIWGATTRTMSPTPPAREAPIPARRCFPRCRATTGRMATCS
ncbi:MAG TPA: hypothetical protein PLL33_11080 [Paracoccus sp. (in: a-proteobacteria)]|nr:hypothetical protein [Paracoccus sp. (in: a-proteobacteria)]